MVKYRSFLFPEASVEVDALTLDPRESHHLTKVMRARVGDMVEVLDGKGSRYLAEVALADAKSARLSVKSREKAPVLSPKITLLQSVTKGKSMDLLLRMATEIGANVIQPVFTHQGEVQIKGERLASKVEKWKVTMIEACKQCGLSYLPELRSPTAMVDWLKQNPPPEKQLRIVACLEAGSEPLLGMLDEFPDTEEVTVAVGPEGDFSAGEYAALRESGFKSVCLGANVLRAETAAAYILSVVDQSLRAGK